MPPANGGVSQAQAQVRSRAALPERLVSLLRGHVRGEPLTRTSRAAVLWLLLALFAGRVGGQLAVALGAAPFLPPMDEWYSGLLPYGPLLVSQAAIVALFARICADLSAGTGYFATPQPWLGRPLRTLGWLYAASMVVRYAVTMALHPERRWTGRTIPIVFHLVLAAFLLVLAGHHRRGRAAS